MRRVWLYLTVIIGLLFPTGAIAQEPGEINIYIPFVGTGPLSPFGDGSIPDPDMPYTAPLPECTPEQLEEMIAGMSDTQSDPNAPSVCSLPVRERYEISGGAVQASNIGWGKKFSINFLNCLSACGTSTGVKKMSGVISAKEPTLAPGKSWDDYFYSGFFQVSDQSQSISCQTGGGGSFAPTIYLGIGKGQASNNPTVDLPTPTIYWEILTTNYCYGFTTYNTIAPYSAILTEVYRDASSGSGTYWTGRVWLGSWVNAFTHEFLPFITAADTIAAGQQVRAKNADYSSVVAPMNFVHKLELEKHGSTSLVSWHDAVLPSPLAGKTITIADSPFGVMDIVGGDYTSISSEIQ